MSFDSVLTIFICYEISGYFETLSLLSQCLCHTIHLVPYIDLGSFLFQIHFLYISRPFEIQQQRNTEVFCTSFRPQFVFLFLLLTKTELKKNLNTLTQTSLSSTYQFNKNERLEERGGAVAKTSSLGRGEPRRGGSYPQCRHGTLERASCLKS